MEGLTWERFQCLLKRCFGLWAASPKRIPTTREKFFLRLTTDSPYVWEGDIEAGTYRLRLGGPGGNNWSYIGTNRGGSGAGIDSEFDYCCRAFKKLLSALKEPTASWKSATRPTRPSICQSSFAAKAVMREPLGAAVPAVF